MRSHGLGPGSLLTWLRGGVRAGAVQAPPFHTSAPNRRMGEHGSGFPRTVAALTLLTGGAEALAPGLWRGD